VARAYGVLGPLGFPHRWTYYIGPDGTVLYVDKNVRTSTAGADMASRLESLGVEKR
jgi:peroxiredoxin Q/BCP